MKYLKALTVIFMVSALIVSCKQQPKEITPELFLELENKILSTDLTPESKEKILDSYGITLKQYNDYEDKVNSDLELKEKIGELRLEGHKK